MTVGAFSRAASASARYAALFCLAALLGGLALGDATPPAPEPEYVEVTATRIPEDAETVPASITIVSGEDLRNRGARDLRGALALAMGIDIALGGDGGPASSVPEMWGLREFDAFLLVVDGIPWGGAFNPSLATLDLSDVERIEVMRGAAPVMYGATSFVGVIQVIRRSPSATEGRLEATAGSYGSGSLAARFALPAAGSFTSSVSANIERRGYKDDRTQFDRGHVLWRAGLPLAGGRLRLDLDGTWLQQDPASPHPREGERLSDAISLDTNHNPRGSHVNERRIFLAAGYEHEVGSALWATQLSATRSNQGILRGFLAEVSNSAPNAVGIRESLDINDVYFDTHFELAKLPRVRLVAGVDHLYGRGRANGGDFDYFGDLDGDDPPDGDDLENAADVKIRDTRNFSGLYGQFEWLLSDAWRFEAGARLNRTTESRFASAVEFDTGETEGGSDRRTITRGSGAAGVTWTPWRHQDDAVRVYANFRNTFKPAAIDFGLEAEGEILAPETAKSYETGVKTRFGEGVFEFDLSAFQMDFENLVVSKTEDGLPGLENAGKSRFRGIEADFEWRLREPLYWRTAYSLHDARFRDFVTEFDGVPTQLEGNRQEMTPRYLAATGLVFAPARGWRGSAQVNYVGSRFLNKRNTAHVRDYVTWSAGIGYRTENWELRLDGTNLNNQRPPVSESELGDAQYYRLPARQITASVSRRF